MTSTSSIKQFAFTETQIAKLMQMQDELNTYIHPEWKSQGFDWNTAIIDECQEILEHLGWKWWKTGYCTGLTEGNKAQVQLEVIDILHFLISLDAQGGVEPVDLLVFVNRPLDSNNIWGTVDWVRNAAATNELTIDTWAALAHSVDLTTEQVIETYTQKYVLNKFRQDHGYKSGSYVKEWKRAVTNINKPLGIAPVLQEDNEVLQEIVAYLKEIGGDTTDETRLYTELKLAYNNRLNK